MLERVRAVLEAAASNDRRTNAWHYRRRLQIFDKTGGHCWHCKNPLGFDWHADHLMPRAAGGSNKLENLVPSCPECNQEKADYIGWTKNPLGFESETQA
jgi:5-methylcytosine-specific restriction endonuclease McrA